ncbi:MAG: hypothetical protein K5787_11305 [Lentisphaeria bacterium]|nr:hypothetical protein [Lentisphaeria bacterium]
MASFWKQLKDKVLGKRLQFAVGYQLPGEMNRHDMVDLIGQYRKSISEVFFAMPGDASGRVPVGSRGGMAVDEARERLFADLDRLDKMGLPGVVLFNSSCYGGEYGAKELAEHVRKSIEDVEKHIHLRAATVISLPFAESIKTSFPDVKVRSSINMHIGTIRQMELLSKYFDGFYLNRDYNRDLEHIRSVRTWCDEHGKSLHMLANSGCIYQCPHHHYHENVVAHIDEIVSQESAYKGTLAPCFRMLTDESIRHWVLRNTWIRPEDIHHYADLFDTIKLATRESSEPEYTLLAYSEEKWNGNLLDILEPGHANVDGMPLIMNSRFPEDWFEHTTHCGHHCDTCNYCKNIFEKVSKARQDATLLM